MWSYSLVGRALVDGALVGRALDYQSKDPMFKTTKLLQGELNLSSFQAQSNECHGLVRT